MNSEKCTEKKWDAKNLIQWSPVETFSFPLLEWISAATSQCPQSLGILLEFPIRFSAPRQDNFSIVNSRPNL